MKPCNTFDRAFLLLLCLTRRRTSPEAHRFCGSTLLCLRFVHQRAPSVCAAGLHMLPQSHARSPCGSKASPAGTSAPTRGARERWRRPLHHCPPARNTNDFAGGGEGPAFGHLQFSRFLQELLRRSPNTPSHLFHLRRFHCPCPAELARLTEDRSHLIRPPPTPRWDRYSPL